MSDISLDEYEQKLGMIPIWVEVSKVTNLFEKTTQHNWARRDKDIINEFVKEYKNDS